MCLVSDRPLHATALLRRGDDSLLGVIEDRGGELPARIRRFNQAASSTAVWLSRSEAAHRAEFMHGGFIEAVDEVPGWHEALAQPSHALYINDYTVFVSTLSMVGVSIGVTGQIRFATATCGKDGWNGALVTTQTYDKGSAAGAVDGLSALWEHVGSAAPIANGTRDLVKLIRAMRPHQAAHLKNALGGAVAADNRVMLRRDRHASLAF